MSHHNEVVDESSSPENDRHGTKRIHSPEESNDDSQNSAKEQKLTHHHHKPRVEIHLSNQVKTQMSARQRKRRLENTFGSNGSKDGSISSSNGTFGSNSSSFKPGTVRKRLGFLRANFGDQLKVIAETLPNKFSGSLSFVGYDEEEKDDDKKEVASSDRRPKSEQPLEEAEVMTFTPLQVPNFQNKKKEDEEELSVDDAVSKFLSTKEAEEGGNRNNNKGISSKRPSGMQSKALHKVFHNIQSSDSVETEGLGQQEDKANIMETDQEGDPSSLQAMEVDKDEKEGQDDEKEVSEKQDEERIQDPRNQMAAEEYVTPEVTAPMEQEPPAVPAKEEVQRPKTSISYGVVDEEEEETTFAPQEVGITKEPQPVVAVKDDEVKITKSVPSYGVVDDDEEIIPKDPPVAVAAVPKIRFSYGVVEEEEMAAIPDAAAVVTSAMEAVKIPSSTEEGEEAKEEPVTRVRKIRFADESGEALFEEHVIHREENYASRIVVMLLSPKDRKFEFLHAEYPLDPSTTVQVVLDQIPLLATNDAFRSKKFTALLQTETSRQLDNALALQDYNFKESEIVLGIPDDFTVANMTKMAVPLLLNKKLMKTVKQAIRKGRGLKTVKSGDEWNSRNDDDGDDGSDNNNENDDAT